MPVFIIVNPLQQKRKPVYGQKVQVEITKLKQKAQLLIHQAMSMSVATMIVILLILVLHLLLIALSIASERFFVAKYDFAGNIIWIKDFGNPNTDYVYVMAIDAPEIFT